MEVCGDLEVDVNGEEIFFLDKVTLSFSMYFVSYDIFFYHLLTK